MKPGGQRTKGRAFEQRIVRLLKASCHVDSAHRSSQADRAHEADIVVLGHPVLERLWMELQDARHPEPRKKLEQAERDIARQPSTRDRLCVVVWHRLGERHSNVTMRLGTLLKVMSLGGEGGYGSLVGLVTIDLREFIALMEVA